MLSTRKDELPVAASTLTTAKIRSTDAAGGSTAVRRTQPERPKAPTAATLTAYSSVTVVAPDGCVATAATCAVSSRKSRAMKKQSHDTSTSAGASSVSESVVGTPVAPATSDAMNAEASLGVML